MKKLFLLAAIPLIATQIYAQTRSAKYAIPIESDGSGQTEQIYHDIFKVSSENEQKICLNSLDGVFSMPKQSVRTFQYGVITDYEECFRKTYELYALVRGDFTSGTLDFCPIRDEIFMRIVWNNDPKRQSEFYRINLLPEGISFNLFFKGTKKETASTPPTSWARMKTQTMFFIHGDLNGFFNTNALFVEDTSIAEKDPDEIREAIVSQKKELEKNISNEAPTSKRKA